MLLVCFVKDYDDDNVTGLSEAGDYTERSGFLTQLTQDSQTHNLSNLQPIDEQAENLLAGDNLVLAPKKV